MDKKTILAFLLIGIIIIVLPYYYKLINPQEEEQPRYDEVEIQPSERPPAESSTRRVTSTRDETLKIVDEAGRPDAMSQSKPGESVQIKEGERWQEDEGLSEKLIKVETHEYIAIMSSRGGKIISFKLKRYSDRRGGMVELIRPGEDGDYYSNAYFTFPNLALSTDGLLYKSNTDYIEVELGETAELVLEADLIGGAKICQRYVFDGSSYRIKVTVETNGLGNISDYYFRWDGSVNITEPDTVQDLSYSKAYAMMGGIIEKFDAPKRGDKKMSPSGKTDWIALRSKYFEIAVIPEGNSEGINFVARKLYHGSIGMKEFELAMKMRTSQRNLNQDFTIYIGPMDSKRLSDLGVGLEGTMNWGWSIIKPFSKLVLWSFKQIHKVIPNYGVVIIVFSILVKLILWPLTHKSFVSMRKMSKLQPMIKELKEKYKKDPQRMQKETMKLYKEKKVNPMGGCLPMLLQMPLLYSLFIVFRSTIELREANFVWWMKDLSLPDTIINLPVTLPLYGDHVTVLPLLMGVSTFFQSKTTITDPNQKMMLYFMPIFLTLMFNNFPAGLTLYYTLFNVLSLIQQRMVNIKDEGIEVKKPSPAKKALPGKKKSK